MSNDKTESAIQDLFRVEPDQLKNPDTVERIATTHDLDDTGRALLAQVATEMVGERKSAAPSMDNASLYRAPSDSLLT